MGFFGGLFGRKDADATVRCMECGMAGGRHTEWCPALEDQDEKPSGTDSASLPDPPSGPGEAGVHPS